MCSRMEVKEVTVKLRFRKRPHGTLVHFKSDGERFESERTVKLNVKSKYTTEITISPVLTMEKCQISGNDQRLLLKQLEDDFVIYKTEWQTTDIQKSKAGDRLKVPMVLQLKKFGSLHLSMQCKFYPEKEIQHVTWGPVLGQVEFKCHKSENSDTVIVEDNFLI